MFFRVKSTGSLQYLQIVHSIRQGEKVRQQKEVNSSVLGSRARWFEIFGG
jgi:hypothetical protein